MSGGKFGTLVRKHRWLMLALLGGTLAAGLTYTLRAPSVFYSRALVKVNRAALGLDPEKQPDAERLRVIIKDLTQPHILERTAARLGTKVAGAALTKQFHLVVRPAGEGDLEVEIRPHSKDWAERWTPTLVEEYVNFRDEKRRQESARATPQPLAFGGKLKPSIRPPNQPTRLNKRLDEIGRVRVGLQDAQLDVAGKLALVAPLLGASLPPLDRLEETQRERALAEALEKLDREFQDLLAEKETAAPQATQTAANIATPDAEPHAAALAFVRQLEISDGPISPNRLQLALATLSLSLALGFGVPLLMEAFDRTRHVARQVEAVFHLPCLGTVPELENARRANRREDFENIRTNLIAGVAPSVVLVTSAVPQEGKTLVAANLARSFAQAGFRTLLIDADLRRGQVHRVFGYRKTPGFCAVLRGEISLDEAIRKTTESNLFTLTAGQLAGNDSALLNSPHFAAALGPMRDHFEQLVIDAPPVLGLADTALLRPHVEGIVFVIRSGSTKFRTVKAALETIGAGKISGFVLNRVEVRKTVTASTTTPALERAT